MTLSTAPPPDSVAVCIDEMGPVAAKSYPGRQVVRARPQEEGQPAQRARQEADYGRRGKGYIVGAFQPRTGETLTAPFPSRSGACFAAFLEQVEAWVPKEVATVYAIMDNLDAHRCPDVLLFSVAYPRSRVRVPTDLCSLSQSD